MTLLDTNTLRKDFQRVIRGPVPKIHILAHKVSNKNVTQIGGPGNTLDLFMIDNEEFRSLLSTKCSASATLRTDGASAKSGSKETLYILVQGDQA